MTFRSGRLITGYYYGSTEVEIKALSSSIKKAGTIQGTNNWRQALQFQVSLGVTAAFNVQSPSRGRGQTRSVAQRAGTGTCSRLGTQRACGALLLCSHRSRGTCEALISRPQACTRPEVTHSKFAVSGDSAEERACCDSQQSSVHRGHGCFLGT